MDGLATDEDGGVSATSRATGDVVKGCGGDAAVATQKEGFD
jgi:hypothetical protein